MWLVIQFDDGFLLTLTHHEVLVFVAVGQEYSEYGEYLLGTDLRMRQFWPLDGAVEDVPYVVVHSVLGEDLLTSVED